MKMRWPLANEGRKDEGERLKEQLVEAHEKIVARDEAAAARERRIAELKLRVEELKEARRPVVRTGAISDDELRKLLLTTRDNAVLLGVHEVINRAEDDAGNEYANEPDAAIRADGGIALRTIRTLRWRLMDECEKANAAKK